MLNNLYRKLHILFASSVMLIITLVISFVVANTVHTEKINESTLFQRLTTLLIYQVESASSDMDKSLKTYEKSYHIFSLISDTKGNTIYQSDFPFPTSADNLLHNVEKQISTQPLSQTESNTTSQGGFLEIRGTHHDTYFVIPATIRTANDTVYHATLSLSDSQFDGYFTKDIAYISSYLAFRLYRCYRSNPLSTEKVVCSNGTNTEKPKRFCCNSVP